MIQADHKRWARALYNPWIGRLLKKSFSHFFLANEIPTLPEEKALLITPNHMSWWDGFFVDYICRRCLDRRFHVMMLEDQLRRFWFFQKLGAFSIEQGDEDKVAETMNYTAGLLRDPENLVVMFPQGVLTAYDRRPIKLKSGGITMLAQESPGTFVILPLCCKILYHTEQYPEIIAAFGAPMEPVEAAGDFTSYIKNFNDTMTLLDSTSYSRRYIRDLFS